MLNYFKKWLNIKLQLICVDNVKELLNYVWLIL